MVKKITITPKANQDLDDCFAYISQDRPETALQFFDATRLTIAQIVRMPGIGGILLLITVDCKGYENGRSKILGNT